MVLSVCPPFQALDQFKDCFFCVMIRAYVMHQRCNRCKYRSPLCAEFSVWALNITGRPLSSFVQKNCIRFKDFLQMNISTKLVCKKVFLSRKQCFVAILLSLMR